MVENCTHIFFSALDFRNILPIYLSKPAPGGSSYSLRSKRKNSVKLTQILSTQSRVLKKNTEPVLKLMI